MNRTSRGSVTRILLLRSGDVEENPGPRTSVGLNTKKNRERMMMILSNCIVQTGSASGTIGQERLAAKQRQLEQLRSKVGGELIIGRNEVSKIEFNAGDTVIHGGDMTRIAMDNHGVTITSIKATPEPVKGHKIFVSFVLPTIWGIGGNSMAHYQVGHIPKKIGDMIRAALTLGIEKCSNDIKRVDAANIGLVGIETNPGPACSLMTAGNCGAKCRHGEGYCEHIVKKIRDEKEKKRKSLSVKFGGKKGSGEKKPKHAHECRAHAKIVNGEKPKRVERKLSVKVTTTDDEGYTTTKVAPKAPKGKKRAVKPQPRPDPNPFGSLELELTSDEESGTEVEVIDWKTELANRLLGKKNVFLKGESQVEPPASSASLEVAKGEASGPAPPPTQVNAIISRPPPPEEKEFEKYVKSHGVDVDSWTWPEESRWRKSFDEQRKLQFTLSLEAAREQGRLAAEARMVETRQRMDAEREERMAAQRHTQDLERERRIEEMRMRLESERESKQRQMAALQKAANGVQLSVHRAKFVGGVANFPDGTKLTNMVNAQTTESESVINSIITKSGTNVSTSEGASHSGSIGGGMFVTASYGHSRSFGKSLSWKEGEDASEEDRRISQFVTNSTATVEYTVRVTPSGQRVCTYGGQLQVTLTWDEARTLEDGTLYLFSLKGDLYFIESAQLSTLRAYAQSVVAMGGTLNYNPARSMFVSGTQLQAAANAVYDHTIQRMRGALEESRKMEVIRRQQEALLEKEQGVQRKKLEEMERKHADTTKALKAMQRSLASTQLTLEDARSLFAGLKTLVESSPTESKAPSLTVPRWNEMGKEAHELYWKVVAWKNKGVGATQKLREVERVEMEAKTNAAITQTQSKLGYLVAYLEAHDGHRFDKETFLRLKSLYNVGATGENSWEKAERLIGRKLREKELESVKIKKQLEAGKEVPVKIQTDKDGNFVVQVAGRKVGSFDWQAYSHVPVNQIRRETSVLTSSTKI